MNKKIAFFVVVLVALVATFCVSFAGMPLAEPVVPDIGTPSGIIPLPESWAGGSLYVDLNIAQSYAEDIYNNNFQFVFMSDSKSLQLQAFSNVEGWVSIPGNFWAFMIGAENLSTYEFSVHVIALFPDGSSQKLTEGIFRFVLSDDVQVSFLVDNQDVMPEIVVLGGIPLFGYFATFEPLPTSSLGETVINNIIDTLWGTVVSVGDSFGEGLNQMVGDLFFDLETGDLSAFSIVIICFFALCLLVTIVNWLFFRLTNIRKF